MRNRCIICETPIEEAFSCCSIICQQVYEHERREDILERIPWEIVVGACHLDDQGYGQLYTILLEIAGEPDNWIKQLRLIRIIRYCRDNHLPLGDLELVYHMLNQSDSPHFSAKASKIWRRDYLLYPTLELDLDLFPLTILLPYQ